MTATSIKLFPQIFARIGGLAYLIIIIAGAMGELFIRNKMIVSGDPLATAHNIAANPFLWRIGIAGDLLMHICDSIVGIVYFVLLRPVNKTLAILALMFGIIQTAVLVSNKMNLVVPLFFLENASYLKSFTQEQLQSLAFLSIKAHGYGFSIGLLFFGFECLIDGYLIFKSQYLPRILGIMIVVAGICYLVNSFVLLLFPAISSSVFPIVMAPILLGELSMALWLLLKGVNMAKWNELVES